MGTLLTVYDICRVMIVQQCRFVMVLSPWVKAIKRSALLTNVMNWNWALFSAYVSNSLHFSPVENNKHTKIYIEMKGKFDLRAHVS